MRWLVRLAICTSVLVVLPLFNFPAPSPARAAGTQSPSCQFVIDALEATDRIKPGMLRSDLGKSFESDGGISSQQNWTYTYRRCNYIKIDVEFEQREIPQGIGAFSGQDPIVKVSKPYLAYPMRD